MKKLLCIIMSIVCSVSMLTLAAPFTFAVGVLSNNNVPNNYDSAYDFYSNSTSSFNGSNIVVVLEDNPNTGSYWRVASKGTASYVMESDEYYGCPIIDGNIGGGGYHVWSFKADSIGSLTFTFEQIANTEDVFKTVVLNYYVDSDLNVNLLGDISGDNIVSVKDLSMLAKAVAKIITLSDKQTYAADVYSDGNITVADLSKLTKYVAEYIHNF